MASRSGPGSTSGEFLRDAHLDVAAELDVGAATGHVGGDRDGARHAGLGDDIGFLLVEAGIEHGEQFRGFAGARRGIELQQRLRLREIDLPIALRYHEFGELFGFLDRRRADEHRLHVLVGVLDLVDDRFQLLGRGAIDLVVLVETPDRHVGRNLDHVELVDLGEFVGLGRGGAGHAGELPVKAEIILEGDRGEGDILRLDGDMLLGFERLMEALRIAPPGHHAAGEFVDDHDLVVADDVILVAMEQGMGLQGLLHVMNDRDIGGIVERALVRGARCRPSSSSICSLPASVRLTVRCFSSSS